MTPRETELAALPQLLSVAEAAKAAHVSPMTIKRAIKAGKLLKNGASKCYSKITKDSLLVFISLRETPAPAQHDVPINEQYEDLQRCEQRTPEPQTASGEDAAFAAECAHYAALLPPVERRFVQQHPKPFSFEDYFNAP
jgi:hypothetical protein